MSQWEGLDHTTPQGVTEPPPDPELTGRVYLSPGTPGGGWGGWRPGREILVSPGPRGGHSGVWLAGLAQPPVRVLALGLILQSFCLLLPEFSWAGGDLPAVTYARVLLSNFLLRHRLPGCAGLAALLPRGGGRAPFPPGQLPLLNNQVLPHGSWPSRAHSEGPLPASVSCGTFQLPRVGSRGNKCPFQWLWQPNSRGCLGQRQPC